MAEPRLFRNPSIFEWPSEAKCLFSAFMAAIGNLMLTQRSLVMPVPDPGQAGLPPALHASGTCFQSHIPKAPCPTTFSGENVQTYGLIHPLVLSVIHRLCTQGVFGILTCGAG